jgi:hypothetical protein
MIFLISVEVAIEPAVGGSPPPPPHTHTLYHWISHGIPLFLGERRMMMRRRRGSGSLNQQILYPIEKAP